MSVATKAELVREMNAVHEQVRFINTRKGIKDHEAELLYQAAKLSRGLIVEVGSYMGRSTAYLALGTMAGNKQHIFSIDPWRAPVEVHLFETFQRNIAQLGVNGIVTPIRMSSAEAYRLKKPVDAWQSGIELLFIDGDHLKAGVELDLRWIDLVNVGGMVVFHDYGNQDWPDVTTVVDRYRNDHPDLLQLHKLKGHLIVFTKVAVI